LPNSANRRIHEIVFRLLSPSAAATPMEVYAAAF